MDIIITYIRTMSLKSVSASLIGSVINVNIIVNLVLSVDFASGTEQDPRDSSMALPCRYMQRRLPRLHTYQHTKHTAIARMNELMVRQLVN